MQKKYPLVLLFCVVAITLFSQVDSTLNKKSGLIDVNSIVIPPLDSCIQKAIESSPLLKANNVQVEMLLQELKLLKTSWLQYVSIDANTRYGLFNQIQIEQANPDVPSVGISTAREQFNYFAGLSIKLPLSAPFKNISDKKTIQLKIKEQEIKREELKNEVIKIVISEYYKLNTAQQKLIVNQNNYLSSNLNYNKATNDLKNNFIGFSEYVSISTANTRAYEALITIKNEFFMQYHLLKLLIGDNPENAKK